MHVMMLASKTLMPRLGGCLFLVRLLVFPLAQPGPWLWPQHTFTCFLTPPFVQDATTPGFTFPELDPSGPYGIDSLQKKQNFAIGISGGGLRAVTLGLGFVSGLWRSKLLQKARYIGGASGEEAAQGCRQGCCKAPPCSMVRPRPHAMHRQ